MTDNETARHENLVVKRILNAPVERVWRAWTEPQHIMRWWGPQYYTSPTCHIDLREGGQMIFAMQAPPEQGGAVHYNGGVFTSIVLHERLEFTMWIADAEGEPIDPAEIGLDPAFPAEIRTSVVFKPIGQMTELTITEYDWPIGQMYVYSLAGMHQSVDKLADSLEDQEMQ
jgi:uncharacterized protein YndB with AHSA1/START domain